MRVRYSPDGIRWSDEQTPTGLGNVGVTHNSAFWDRRIGKHVRITGKFLGEQLVYRSTSDGFLTWTELTLALRSTEVEGKDHPTYCMLAFPYADGYLGFVMMYHVAAGRMVDAELARNPDGVRWRRVFAGRAFIPRGPKGSYDSACIYVQVGPPVARDGKLYVIYGGNFTIHLGWKRSCLPCPARLRLDGVACYEPTEKDRPGILTTRPLRSTGDPLRANTDAAGGRCAWLCSGSRVTDLTAASASRRAPPRGRTCCSRLAAGRR